MKKYFIPKNLIPDLNDLENGFELHENDLEQLARSITDKEEGGEFEEITPAQSALILIEARDYGLID
jgi:hypothetical protein